MQVERRRQQRFHLGHRDHGALHGGWQQREALDHLAQHLDSLAEEVEEHQQRPGISDEHQDTPELQGVLGAGEEVGGLLGQGAPASAAISPGLQDAARKSPGRLAVGLLENLDKRLAEGAVVHGHSRA